jgi:hypothetical protein
MFTVDEKAAAAIRRTYEKNGELGAIVEFRRHFLLIADNAKGRECVRALASWGLTKGVIDSSTVG